jgi:hypothetical protein
MSAPTHRTRVRPPRQTLQRRLEGVEAVGLAAVQQLDLGPEWRAYDAAHTAAIAKYDAELAAAEAAHSSAMAAADDAYRAALKGAGAELGATLAPFRAALPAVSA